MDARGALTVVRGRSGMLLVETLLALSLGAMVLTGLAVLFTSVVRLQGAFSERAEAYETARIVWFVLDDELGAARAGRDWALGPDGVLELRAFRGFGRVCPAVSGTSHRAPFVVAFRGQRLPEPVRDSVLVLGADGDWRAHGLLAASSGSGAHDCTLAPGESFLTLEWDALAATPPPVLVRLFERGSYHLADGAFRYRRGDGGRQPLTAETLGNGSRFTAAGSSLEVTLELESRTGAAPRAFSWRTGWGEAPP